MLHTYKFRKTRWGIIITVDIQEVRDFSLTEQSIYIVDNIYLEISESIRLKKELILEFISPVLRKHELEIKQKTENKKVCFFVKSIEYDPADFQLEGLYCVMEEWLSIYYGLNIPSVKVDFDRLNNKYDFEIDFAK